jgi:hypothetical protein
MGFQHFVFPLYKKCVQEASYLSLISVQKNKRSSFRRNNKEANSVRVSDKKKDVSNIKCYNCQKLGHFSYDYSQGKGKRKHQAHVAEEEEYPPSKKALAEIKDYALKLKIVDLKKDRKWWSPWSLPTQKQKISIHVYF